MPRSAGVPVVSPDETGWRVGAVLHWLWAFATPATTVYAIRPGRGFDDAATILGADFAGVLVRDGWAPYRRFTDARHQSCLAHLLRRCRLLRVRPSRSPWAARVQAVLTDALALRDRRDAQAITDQGLAVAHGRLLARLSRLIDTAPALPAAQRFAAHLDGEFPAVLAFLWAPDVDATNWRAEHAIRPAVVNRKICGGNRTPRGARTQQILASVVRTARQRHVDLDDLLPRCCGRHDRLSRRLSTPDAVASPAKRIRKTLCVFHELPQGLSNQITHEKPRKAPKWRWETRIDPKNSRALREEVDYGINSMALPVIVVYPDFSNKSDIIGCETKTIRKQVKDLWVPHTNVCTIQPPAGQPRRGKRLRMCSCPRISGEVVYRSVDGRLRGPRFWWGACSTAAGPTSRC